MAQTAGHRPATLGEPGSVTEARKAPPVKQNLFLIDNQIRTIIASCLHTKNSSFLVTESDH